MTIDSATGRGTTVKLYLPCAVETRRSEETDPENETPRGKGERVLVIEDDPDVRALAVRLLTRLGYRVTDVADAATALSVLASGSQVDLVLSDVVLPGGVSGPEFAERARAANPSLKVIFMSGYASEAAKHNGFPAPDTVLLNKPFKKGELAKALQDALR